MTKAIWLSAFLLSLSLRECGKKAPSPATPSSPSQKPQTDLYIRIERTPCYGRCPIDKVELFPNGQIRYEGQRFVPRLGVYNRTASAKELSEIEKALQEAKFEQYAELYDNPGISDLPSLVIEYRLQGKTRKITCRTGCPPELPDKIERLRTLLAEQGDFQMEKGPEEESSTQD
jgi:hypothetical protein